MKLKVRGIILGDARPSDIVIEHGSVVSIRPADPGKADLGSRTAAVGPTLFDIQVNGVRGIDLQSARLAPEHVREMTDILATWGVSHWAPTLVTGPLDRIERACRVIAEALHDKAVARAVPGIHIEGPYISPQDGPRGAHARRYVRKPCLREFDRLFEAAEGHVLYVTLAPELDGAIPFIKALVRRGVVVALGHHNATETHIRKAVDAGARLCTHLGNGLASYIPRHQNPLWPQLAEDRLAASFIADLHHLPPAALKSLIRGKGPENTILTSDCIHAALLKPGRYALAGLPIEVKRSGRVCLTGTDLLAGSSLMLLQGVANAARVTDLSLEQAFAAATTIPARVLGLRHRFAPPQVGKKAEFLVFETGSPDTDKHVKLHGVFIAGGRKR